MPFEDLNLREFDRSLSTEEQKEWNAIYASYKAQSFMTGRVAGLDTIHANTVDRQKSMCFITVIPYRVKILIPETEIWFDESERRPEHVLKSMFCAEIDFVITKIDRPGGCALASRRLALARRRKKFKNANHVNGDLVSCRILAVGSKKLLAECGGYDFNLTQRDITYSMTPDLREKYRPGYTCDALLKSFDPNEGILTVSVKETEPHPFDGVEIRYPLGCRRASVITGKYGGGVFCRLDERLDCLCIYSPYQNDRDFAIGDEVIVVITQYDYERKLVYGRIVAKW